MFQPTVRRPATHALLLAASLLLAACGTLTSSGTVPAEANASWALLPIDNLSSTPLAGRKALALVETRLRTEGVTRIANVEPETGLGLVALLDDAAHRDEALRRARASGHRYAVGGTVHEWQYRSAPDREPVVGLSLTLVEVGSGRVLWQGSAARSGWGNASLSSVADKVVATLLDEVRITAADRRAAD